VSPVTAACPNCGGAVEFRYDDSFVRVCSYCNAVVGRSDRGFQSLGRMGDLAASESPLALFARGRLGEVGFELIGRAQIAHSRGGGWEEWYARFDNGTWGWLSEAQGRFQLTFAAGQPPGLPPFQSLWPGQTFTLELAGRAPETFTVTEIGEATYRAAAGEMPYQLVAGMRFRYADLSGDRGSSATVDAGVDAGDQLAFYLGREVSLLELGFTAAPGGGPGPDERAPPTRVSAVHVACVQCGGSLELRAPDRALRVTCPYCGALHDVNQGHLSYLRTLEPESQMIRPEIPLGSAVELGGPALTVIGCMRRSVSVEGIDYPFTEYLLYHPDAGYRWLVDSEGQWNHVTLLSAGAVSLDALGVRHEGRRFRHFQSAGARVDRIFGEFYWRVELGEQVSMSDYVSPPLMLSSEEGGGEINWSLGEWMEARDLSRRIRPPGGEPGSLALRQSSSVAPNQPYRHRGILAVTAVVGLLLIAATAVLHGAAADRSIDLVFDPPLDAATEPSSDSFSSPLLAGTQDAPPASRVHFSQPFELEAGQNLAFHFKTSLDNSWLYVAADLVNDATGETDSFDTDLESYHGYEDGESWSEGDSDKAVYLRAVAAGRYALRLEAQWPSNRRAPTLEVRLRQGEFRTTYFIAALALLLIGPILVGVNRFLFERRRWAESDHAWSSGGSDE
jgi:hypothetical protein